MDQEEMNGSRKASSLPVKGFFKLPREMRDLVYFYAVVARHKDGGHQPDLALKLQLNLRRCKREVVSLLREDPTKWPELTTVSPSVNVNLLYVSRQVNIEAEEVFYKDNTFVISPRFYSMSWVRPSSLGYVLTESLTRRPLPAHASDQLTSLRSRSWCATESYEPSPELTNDASIHERRIRSQVGRLLIDYKEGLIDFRFVRIRAHDYLDSCNAFLCRIAALPNLRRLYLYYIPLATNASFRVPGYTITGLVNLVLGRVRDIFEVRKARGLPSVDIHLCGTTLGRLNDTHEWKHWSLLDCTNEACTRLDD
ncbi:hypothetical protein BU16DRAFT_530014 [Lophium mytilinum]|uniref:F-box domain-containing protein n=1 Tax=Lophium mytilinum TaxID=390894 RepID=A0A6A6QIP1_9PEZI|nr:hypothetical protein BU16DRAFT_530014 [Lophium mytilinum]